MSIYTLTDANLIAKEEWMSILEYLLIAFGLIGGVYVFYRHTFLKKPKTKHPFSPHFTLKIEGDQT